MDDPKVKRPGVEASGNRTGEDRISKLHDSLICQILSHLPTKDSVRTSVLSSRWKSLWQWVPGLELHSDEFPDYSAFVSFVDRFLNVQSDSHLHKFCLSYFDDENDDVEHDTSRCESWVKNVVKRKIQRLEVQCLIEEYYIEMPLTLYTCENLVRLELHYVILNTPKVVSLPCLKVMIIEGAKYANDLALEMLIAGSPVLEELTIIREPYDNLKVLRVCSKTLRRFSLEVLYFDDGEGLQIAINAPGLKYVSFIDLGFRSVLVNNLGSSVEVDVDVGFTVEHGNGLDANDLSKRNMIRSYLTGISTVRRAIISPSTSEAIYQFSKLEPLPQFCRLLHLDAAFSESFVEVLPTLLKSCPNLKSLILRLPPFEEKEIRFSSTPSCIRSTLEFVEIEGNIMGEATGMMDIVKYFLANSALLKKLIIRPTRVLETNEESFVLEELLSYPRRSTVCEVGFGTD